MKKESKGWKKKPLVKRWRGRNNNFKEIQERKKHFSEECEKGGDKDSERQVQKDVEKKSSRMPQFCW